MSFVNLGYATVDKPLIINIAKNRMYMQDGLQAVQIKDLSIKNKRAKSTCEPIFQLIVQMYLKLTFSHDKNSFYQQNSSDQERIRSVLVEVKNLQEMIGEFVGVRSVALDDLLEDFDKTQIDSFKSKRKIFDTFPQKLDFNSLVRSCLNVKL